MDEAIYQLACVDILDAASSKGVINSAEMEIAMGEREQMPADELVTREPAIG